ncbi:phytanoyl-CoA dioxygenase family protein [Immersiella caudata]|uniref:Phytanoyl-CoA dioxygenase family protein n=1 Tax=Immersiella caudata TaxID=314043 RepID=A0AA39WAS3_9PEZI|nr:phytanoyl-CoA dioxygenase family protein [Immersiella caudata]
MSPPTPPPSVNATSSPKLQRLPASAGSPAILSALRADGAVIIKSLFSPSAIATLNAEINPLMSPIRPGSVQPSEFIQAFHGPTTKRLNNLVGLSPTFRSVFLENDLIHECCTSIFVEDSGGYWMNSAQVIDIPPGSVAQPLHRDQWQFPVFTLVGPDAPEASCNFIVALSEFRAENGATRVIPGSHRWEDMSVNGEEGMSVAAEMEVGDVCFISGKVVHGGGANTTGDSSKGGQTRRGLAMVFQASYLTPEEAFPFNVDREVARGMSERGQRMVGYRSQALKDSPGVWKRDYGQGEEVYC